MFYDILPLFFAKKGIAQYACAKLEGITHTEVKSRILPA